MAQIDSDTKSCYIQIAEKTHAFKIIKAYDVAYAKFSKKDGSQAPSFDVDKAFNDLSRKYGGDFIKFIRNFNNNQYLRFKRLYKKINNYLLLGPCVWLTLNFNDDVLSSTSQKTRRKYVREFLKSISNHYIANIDFGSDREYIDRKGNQRKATKREHYHAIVQIDWLDGNWAYGWMFREKIRKCDDDVKRVSNYVNKLTYHAFKTGENTSLIYSRDIEKIDWSDFD